MKTREDRMIDYVAKAYESNRFDPREARREFERRIAGGRMATRRALWRVAGIAAVLVAGIFIYSSWRNAWTEYAAYDVAQTFILSDSTSVTLAPGATLRVQKHKDERLAYMTGKVYFDVRRNERAPFRVDVGGDCFVKVLGTKFQVNASGNIPGETASVNVISGKVRFSVTESSGGLVLTKGMGAVLRSGAEIPEEIAQEHPNMAAWATGEFVYDNAPLDEVLSELSDYYGVTLTTQNPGSHQLTGQFSTSSLEDILSLIHIALGVNVEILQPESSEPVTFK